MDSNIRNICICLFEKVVLHFLEEEWNSKLEDKYPEASSDPIELEGPATFWLILKLYAVKSFTGNRN